MKITIKTFLFQENSTLDAEQFAQLKFRNQGETVATVQGNIRLYPGDEVDLSFDQTGVVIDQAFVIKFEAQAGKKNSVVAVAGVLTK